MIWGMGYGGPWPMMGIGYGIVGIIWMFISMLIFLFFPIIFFIYFIKWIIKERHYKGHFYEDTADTEALSILKKRYANGEITKEQYEEMKNTIKDKR
ncbi:MAG: SHOCT domain-containing protein [Deltaproteobacteria bacterium]|nr:SHOCT domain-containing protein [Deltaproteobacteria bacterium]